MGEAVSVARRICGWTEALGRIVPATGVLVATAIVLAACSSVGGSVDTMIEPTAAPSNVISPGLNPPSTDPEHDRIVASYGGVYDDPAAAQALARAVGRLVAASDDPSQAYRITILNASVVNAFALPTGNLYVTRGLLALANDTSEVAAVIAHEMAHVTARHAIARQRRQEAALVVNRALSNAPADSDAQRLALTTTQLSLARFSQVQELEADAIGVRTLARAGFDPFAASRFLSSMARYAEYRANRAGQQGEKGRPDFLSSHPSTPERITFAVRAAREIAAPGIGEQERERYLQGLDGMIFGDNPSEGFVRGRNFQHKALGIQFTVPQGYTLENSSVAVHATDAQGTAMRFDGVAVPQATALTDYLASGWINGLVRDSIRPMQVGEFQGAAATAITDGWTFRVGVVRYGKTTYRFIFAAQDQGVSLDEAFQQTLQSFRRLTPEESARLRPLRLRLVKVKMGDTVDKLAEQMSGVDRKSELFRVLNGLEPGEQPDPGKLMKVVTDQ
ncbi:M48 family metalloprotease [Methyloraptor flagellatus]|uniref:M48 family metalloprotease n=1 Tax=Methyloraptor flagellatus TaxID=3162530 RepID=A0AAU7X8R0_9HYPH